MSWQHVANIADFDGVDVIGRSVGEQQIALFKLDGTFYATSGWCTHAHVLLCGGEIVDGMIECPGHFGYFDIASGKAQGAPVSKDLQTYAVRISGSRVEVDVV